MGQKPSAPAPKPVVPVVPTEYVIRPAVPCPKAIPCAKDYAVAYLFRKVTSNGSLSYHILSEGTPTLVPDQTWTLIDEVAASNYMMAISAMKRRHPLLRIVE